MATLHITNGDSAGDKLRPIVNGPVAVTADVLYQGPVPRDDGDVYYQTRARVLGGGDGETRMEEIRQDLERSDRRLLDAAGRGDDLVLWFEHDLFDQLLLIRTLAMLARSGAASPLLGSVSMICIDHFPGVERFIGLGQLTERQLATLIGTERPVRPEQYAVATAAWNAFRAPDPQALFAMVPRPMSDSDSALPLPFLADALRRLFAEYPSALNGLPQTAQLALETLDGASMQAHALFVATQSREPRPFMGDSTFYDMLHALATARAPLIVVNAESARREFGVRHVAITAAGRDVLIGRSDAIALNGIDLWRGGVHLAGRERSPWRWDARRQTLVS